MKNRFDRAGQPKVSFFAFQDIITAVTGILVLITMLLSLFITAEGAADTYSKEDMKSREDKLKALYAKISELRKTLSVPPDQSASASPESLKMDMMMLEIEGAALKKLIQKRKLSNESVKPGAPDLAANAELENAEFAHDVAVRQTVELQKLADSEVAQKTLAEASLIRKQEELLAADRKRNNLILIPDESDTTKKPLIVQLSLGRIVFEFEGGGEKFSVSSPAEFVVELEKHPTDQIFPVFYVKPSANDYAENLVNQVRSKGYAVGYDAIPEDFTVELDSTTKTK